MFKIEAIIQPSKLADVRAAVQELDVAEIFISEVISHGGPSSHKMFYRGTEYSVDSPMMKLGVLVSSLRVDEVVEAITRAARTGFSTDDGIILIYEVADAMRIRSGDRVELALS